MILIGRLNEFTLEPLREAHLETVLNWRNADSVRKYMTHQHIITVAEHRRWFERSIADETHECYVLHWNDAPVAFVQFTDIDPHLRQCSWGFYASPEVRGVGIGTFLGYKGLENAFGKLGMDTVLGTVLDLNDASRRLHERLGFTRIATNRDNATIDYQIIRGDWDKRSPQIRAKIEQSVQHP